MPKVTVNDIEMLANEGETLLDVARRNAAHIGFFCDGNGICQTCECKVLEGAEALTAPSEAEETWLAPSRMERGHRLACQAIVNGETPISVLTRAEELRRQVRDAITPPIGTEAGDNLQKLVSNLVQMNLEHLSLFPGNVVRTVERVGLIRTIFPVDTRRFQAWLNEGQRVIEVQADPVQADIAQAVRVEIPPATPDAQIKVEL